MISLTSSRFFIIVYFISIRMANEIDADDNVGALANTG